MVSIRSLGIRSPLGVVAIGIVCALLTGCAPDAGGSEAQFEACRQFEGASVPLLNSFTDAPFVDWDEELDRVRSIAGTAEGEVKIAMISLITEIPARDEIVNSPEVQRRVNELIEAVSSACAAEGTPIKPNFFVIAE